MTDYNVFWSIPKVCLSWMPRIISVSKFYIYTWMVTTLQLLTISTSLD